MLNCLWENLWKHKPWVLNTCSCTNVPCLLTCFAYWHANILTCFACLCVHMSTCFSCLGAHMPTCLACSCADVPTFIECLRTLQVNVAFLSHSQVVCARHHLPTCFASSVSSFNATFFSFTTIAVEVVHTVNKFQEFN